MENREWVLLSLRVAKQRLGRRRRPLEAVFGLARNETERRSRRHEWVVSTDVDRVMRFLSNPSQWRNWA